MIDATPQEFVDDERRRAQARRELDWPAAIDPAGEYDLLGRKQLKQLNFVHFSRAIPGYVARFAKRVPDEFIAQVADGIVEVACPCRTPPEPQCETWVPTACGCGRTFVYTGREVRVAYGRSADTES